MPAGSLLGFAEDSGCHVYVLTSATAYRLAPDATSPPAGDRETCPTEASPLSSGSPPASTIAADSTAPQLRIRTKRQRLRGYVGITATCSEQCALRAAGTLILRSAEASRAGTANKLIPVSRSAGAGVSVRLRLKLRKRARKPARAALIGGGRVTARLRIVAADASGNVTRERARVRLTPPAP